MCAAALALCNSLPAAAEPSAAATAAYDAYVRAVEARLARQHAAADGFLAGTLAMREIRVERLTPTPGSDLPGAMLHHWRATAFVPGATAAVFERLLRNVADYPQLFAPEVLQATANGETADRMQMTMRVRQRHGITVVMDSAYAVEFGRLDASHGWSASRSDHIAEIDAAGTPREHTLSPAEEHGFLWRQNTYWSWAERDGGLALQVESVSLSRAIPTGLAWAIRPFVESVPRESLEFTLHAVCTALKR
jgi:hypothetical protein